jgi:hypothetical protein
MNTLPELKQAVHDYAENCHDAIASTKSLQFEGRKMGYGGASPLFANALEQGTLNDWSANQLCQKLDAPSMAWLFEPKHCPEELEADILNKLCQLRPEANLLIRSKGDNVRAVLSDQYTKFDNTTMIDLVEEAIDTMKVSPLVKRVSTGDEMSAYVLIPEITFANDPRSKGGTEGNLHPAIHISNSERGGGTAKIVGAVFSGYCQNGMIFGWSANETMAVRHRYISQPVMGALIAQSIALGFKMSEEAAKKFVASQEIHVEKANLSNLVDDWSRTYGISVPTKENWLAQITGEINRNERPEDPRLFDVINGATWLAQTLPVDESILMERVAGDMLASQFPRARR